MKRKLIAIATIAAIVTAAWATQRAWVKISGNFTNGISLSGVDSVKFDETGQNILLVTKLDTIATLSRTSIEKLFVGEVTEDVEINFVGDDAEIINPYAFEGVEVTKDGADVVVKSTTDLELRYRITGTTTTGQVKIYSDKRFTLALDGANITNNDGSAINIQSKKKITVELVDGTTTNLVDASKYTKTPEGEDEKACFFSEGQLLFIGNGTLNVTGNKKHAIASDDYVRIDAGTINIVSSKSDGIHANDYFMMKGGTSRSASSAGDGIDADAGYIVIDDGLIDVTVAGADTKAVKADSIITINGGTINMTVSGDQAKGIKSKHNIFVNGGTITANCTGKVVVVDGDPSYCTGIKTDRNFTFTGGDINITATGEAAKGISVDSIATFSGGNAIIVASGANGAYTDAEGKADTYSSSAISVDCETNISAGSLDLTAAGNDGKGLNSDKDVTISGGTINITGSGRANKGISGDANGYFNGGNFTIKETGNGGTYRLADNTIDGLSSTCITIDGNLDMIGGTYNLNNSGTAGKCLKVDGVAVFGNTTQGPSITANTSGAKISKSSVTWTNPQSIEDEPVIVPQEGPGGPGGPGGNQKYANPKVIKAVGNLTVNNGTLTLTSTQDGGEALESKAVLTINGGTVKCSTVDDCINAKTSLVINGGQVYCNASNNDAIDSNGTMTITGGIVIALGALAPEEGLDCDNNAFTITGGTVVGIGSGNSTVTTKGSNQTFVTLNQTLAQGASLSYTTNGGGHFKFTNPRSYTGSGGGPGGGSGGSRLGILISYPKNATSTGTYTTYFSCLQLDY